MEQPPFEAEASAHKRAKWSQEIKEKTAEGEPSHRTRASKETNANQENLQDKQPCSVSDLLMTKVKHSVVSTLTSIRRFREELKTKEQELEDTLQEIKNLGEMCNFTNLIYVLIVYFFSSNLFTNSSMLAHREEKTKGIKQHPQIITKF